MAIDSFPLLGGGELRVDLFRGVQEDLDGLFCDVARLVLGREGDEIPTWIENQNDSPVALVVNVRFILAGEDSRSWLGIFMG